MNTAGTGLGGSTKFKSAVISSLADNHRLWITGVPFSDNNNWDAPTWRGGSSSI